ncbi:MAG: prepilin-type N-terminal cleavage/methylation domain-containing protein [Planctomycetota bacterium]
MSSSGVHEFKSSRVQARGFTLLEVLLAVSILAIAMVYLLKTRNNSVQMAAGATWLPLAASLAEEKTALALAGVPDGESGASEDYPELTWKFEEEEYAYPIPEDRDAKEVALRKLTVTIHCPGISNTSEESRFTVVTLAPAAETSDGEAVP